MDHFRIRLAKAFADVEIKYDCRVRWIEVSDEVYREILNHISDQFVPNGRAAPGNVGNLWGADVVVDPYLIGNKIIMET